MVSVGTSASLLARALCYIEQEMSVRSRKESPVRVLEICSSLCLSARQRSMAEYKKSASPLLPLITSSVRKKRGRVDEYVMIFIKSTSARRRDWWKEGVSRRNLFFCSPTKWPTQTRLVYMGELLRSKGMCEFKSQSGQTAGEREKGSRWDTTQ